MTIMAVMLGQLWACPEGDFENVDDGTCPNHPDLELVDVRLWCGWIVEGLALGCEHRAHLAIYLTALTGQAIDEDSPWLLYLLRMLTDGGHVGFVDGCCDVVDTDPGSHPAGCELALYVGAEP